MNDLQDKIFLSQNPCIFGRALGQKNYWMTQLIEQTPEVTLPKISLIKTKRNECALSSEGYSDTELSINDNEGFE
jgi:hypothetical protein